MDGRTFFGKRTSDFKPHTGSVSAVFRERYAVRSIRGGVILALMLRQYNQLLQLKELLESAGESEAAAQLKINPWILSKKLRPLVDRLRRDGLESCLEECMKADFDYKTGKITPELAVERLIVLCCIVKRQEEGQRG